MEADAPRPFRPSDASQDDTPPSRYSSLGCWVSAFNCAFALLAIPVAFFLGGIIGQSALYRNTADRQQARIEGFLSQHPNSFGGLTVEHASDGWAYPIGTVPTQSDYDMLSTKLHEMFGDELAEQIIYAVDVETEH